MAPSFEDAEDVEDQDISWQAEEDHDECRGSVGFGPLAHCRGSLLSALRHLLRGRAAAEAASGGLQAAAPHEQLFKRVKVQGHSASEKPLEGTLPSKAIQLTKVASARDLHLGFSWAGPADLGGFCVMLGPGGELRRALWDGARGGLDSCGVQLAPPLGQGADNLIGLDKGAFKLRLHSVPEDVYACVFALTAEQTDGGERVQSADAFLRCAEVTARLSTSPFQPHFWRQINSECGSRSNMWVNLILYRGTFGGWRLEPLNMRLMMRALEDGTDDPAKGVQETATTLAWRFRWFLTDRRWQTAADERGLRRDGNCPK